MQKRQSQSHVLTFDIQRANLELRVEETDNVDADEQTVHSLICLFNENIPSLSDGVEFYPETLAR